jgi:hypothetical protein
MVRTLIATAEQFEELVVRQEGLRFPTSVSWIADYMKSLADRGLLAILNPVHATRRFAHLAMQGSRYYMGYEVPSDAMREYFAWQTVRLFVGGLRGGSERLPGGRIS